MSINAIGYARVASPENSDTLIENQFDAIRNYAKENDITITQLFSDVCSSFKERMQFSNMIGQIKFGDIQTNLILVSSFDRLSRDREQLWGIHETLKTIDVKIISIEQGELKTSPIIK